MRRNEKGQRAVRLSDLAETTADALRSAGSRLLDLMTPTLRLVVTGLARSGKTVFITALVRSLVSGGRLPFFLAMAEGRIARAYLEPQPDDALPPVAIPVPDALEKTQRCAALVAHAAAPSSRIIAGERVTGERFTNRRRRCLAEE